MKLLSIKLIIITIIDILTFYLNIWLKISPIPVPSEWIVFFITVFAHCLHTKTECLDQSLNT